MSSMYNAQKGIQSSFKVAKEGAPSGLAQFGKSNTGKTLKALIGGGLTLEGLKKLLTGNF